LYLKTPDSSPKKDQVHGSPNRIRSAPGPHGHHRRRGMPKDGHQRGHVLQLAEKARRLEQLEEANQYLKQLVADLSLDKQMLQDVLKKRFKARAAPARGPAPPRRLPHFRSSRLAESLVCSARASRIKHMGAMTAFCVSACANWRKCAYAAVVSVFTFCYATQAGWIIISVFTACTAWKG